MRGHVLWAGHQAWRPRRNEINHKRSRCSERADLQKSHAISCVHDIALIRCAHSNTRARLHVLLHARRSKLMSYTQIKVPPQLAEVLKDYTKEVIRRQPEDLIEFSAYYFSNLANILPQNNATISAPTIHQIAGIYKAVTASGTVRTCDVRCPSQPICAWCCRIAAHVRAFATVCWHAGIAVLA